MLLLNRLSAAAADCAPGAWVCVNNDGPDPNAPLCTSAEDLAAWGQGVGPSSCRPDKTASELLTDPWVHDAAAGLAGIVKTLTTFWITPVQVNIGSPDGTASEPVAFLQSHLLWYTFVFLTISLIIGGIKMFWDHRGDEWRKILRLMLNFAVFQGMGVAIVSVLLLASGAFSVWILDESTLGAAFGDNLFTLVSGGGLMVGIVGLFLLLVAAGAAGVQVLIMMARSASLFVLVGTLGIAAACYITDTGERLVKSHVTLLLGFIFYQPIAAMIYATGFKLISSDLTTDDGYKMVMQGIMLIILAIFALPATMRAISPVVSSQTEGRGAGNVAMGAVMMAPTLRMMTR